MLYISTRIKQCVAYADILLTTRTRQAAVETFIQLKERSEQLGLIMNIDKTKYLKCKKGKEMDDIIINEEHIQQVESFEYLGSLASKDNSSDEEIKERTVMGNKAFHANAALFKSKLISKSAELNLYNSLIKPLVTYACETWVLREYCKETLLAFERKILTKMYAPFEETDNT
jgi:hypothetical protein